MPALTPHPPASALQPAARQPGARRTAWLLFAPPAALVGLRWVLNWQLERGPPTPALALTPFTGAHHPWGWLATLGWVLLALAVAGVLAWALRRQWGAGALRRVALGLWLALCGAGGAAQLQGFFNVQGRQPLAPVTAQVLGSRAQAPSVRGPGGTLLVLRLAALASPQQVLIDDPQAVQWQPGQRVLLQWARGRSSGLFVTGWQPVGAAPAPALAQ